MSRLPAEWWWREYPDRDCEYVRWYPPALTEEARGEVWTDPPGAPPPGKFGLYIHVPFCQAICPFCPFVRYPLRPGALERYLAALGREVEFYGRSGYFTGEVTFIYFGGGTPSLMSPDQFHAIMGRLQRSFRVARDAEVTLEAHPLSVGPENLEDLRRAGVTRLSLGIQSFTETTLRNIKTRHTAGEAHAVAEAALAAGFESVSIDLMFRGPGQRLADWERDLEKTIELRVPHVSCYSMVLDPDSPLQQALDRGQVPPMADEEADLAMAGSAFRLFEGAGYAPYALCSGSGFSFAQPGHECRYDTEQWAAPQSQFLGLGVSAYGFIRGYVTANTGDLDTYHEAISAGRPALAGAVRVTPEEAMSRYMVLGVKVGRVPKEPFREQFGVPLDTVFAGPLAKLEGWGLISNSEAEISVTTKGRLYIDNVSKAFYSPAMYRRPQTFQGGGKDEGRDNDRTDHARAPSRTLGEAR